VPSTELVHWRFFGYSSHPFPGRACIEALGAGMDCAPGDASFFLALRRTARRADGAYRVVGGYGEDFGDAGAAYAELDGLEDGPTGYRFEVLPLAKGEAILRIVQGDYAVPPSGDVTDSDPFFFTDLPVLRPRPLEDAADPIGAATTADALDRFLSRAAEVLRDRSGEREGPETPGRLVVHKWSGTFRPLPQFVELTGLGGASVASGRLMRGLARLIGLRFVEHPVTEVAPENELTGKLEDALELLFSGEAGFAHVHTKAADEAAHGVDEQAKVKTIEELDRGLSALLEISPDRLVACVTADHCTPVRGRTVHWGDSVPVVVRGPHARVDGVNAFGERSVAGGTLGQLSADDLLPFLLCQAEQAHFLGARPTPAVPLGIPASGEPWVLRERRPGDGAARGDHGIAARGTNRGGR
jgi:2,3-bisphosphoglycerate-independent phosphoglycerate mutase